MDRRITQESDPVFWDSLRKQWLAEKQPGWIARRSGGEMWKAVQLSDGTLAFDEITTQNYYESTSI